MEYARLSLAIAVVRRFSYALCGSQAFVVGETSTLANAKAWSIWAFLFRGGQWTIQNLSKCSHTFLAHLCFEPDPEGVSKLWRTLSRPWVISCSCYSRIRPIVWRSTTTVRYELGQHIGCQVAVRLKVDSHVSRSRLQGVLKVARCYLRHERHRPRPVYMPVFIIRGGYMWGTSAQTSWRAWVSIPTTNSPLLFIIPSSRRTSTTTFEQTSKAGPNRP